MWTSIAPQGRSCRKIPSKAAWCRLASSRMPLPVRNDQTAFFRSVLTMTQFSTPIPRRSGGDLDVYTGLLCAAFLVLLGGVILMGTTNMKHSAANGRDDGGLFKIVSKR